MVVDADATADTGEEKGADAAACELASRPVADTYPRAVEGAVAGAGANIFFTGGETEVPFLIPASGELEVTARAAFPFGDNTTGLARSGFWG